MTKKYKFILSDKEKGNLEIFIDDKEESIELHNSSTPVNENVSKEIVYQEMYNEMRRARDYEISSSTWYTTLLTIFLALIFTIKFGVTQNTKIIELSASSVKNIFTETASMLSINQFILKIGLTLIIIVIGFLSISTVIYAGKRYREMRNWVDKNLEPDWKKFTPHRYLIEPNLNIVLVQIFVIAISLVIIWV